MRDRTSLCRWALWAVSAAAAACVLAEPQRAAQGVRDGLALCARTVIPTMFPFLVFSRLVLEGPGARWLGLLLRPFTALLGVRSRRSGAAVLCGLFGGFAAGAQCIGALRRSGEVGRRQAGLLLIAASVSGPAFVVGGVGGMLGSTAAGWLLYASQAAAALICALAFSLFSRGEAPSPPRAGSEGHSEGFAAALAAGVQSTCLLCGYVALFSFFTAVTLPASQLPLVRFAGAALLEVTTACRTAAALDGRLYLCAAAISLLGASVFVQVRALAGSDVPLAPLAAARVLHLPLTLGFTALGARFLPGAVAASSGERLVAMRMPADAACVVFLLCALALCGKDGLRKRENAV